jgi:hypothetical protein
MNGIAFCEVKGLAKCFDAYAEIGAEDIMEIGFNENSGYIYIALENGISICSCLGREVEYLVTNFETGEESFFTDYENAIEFLDNLNTEEQ